MTLAPAVDRTSAPHPEIKGWCPGALRPMPSGDGLLVRIRPPCGRLTPAQAAGVAKAARTHGNGTLDLSSRANLQLRGVRPGAHAALIDDLSALGLIDPDIETESLRNLIITPFRKSPPSPSLPHAGGREVPPSGVMRDADAPHPPSPVGGRVRGKGHHATTTDTLAAILAASLARMPLLPGKFGFAIDTGPRPVLTETPADIRLERDTTGQLILRPDGYPLGQPVTGTSLADAALALAHWFLTTGGAPEGRGRMAPHLARAALPEGFTTPPAPPLPPPGPGMHPEGALVAFAFGQMQAATLGALATLGHDLRLTPWRMILIAGAAQLPDLADLITAPDDPLLRVTACTGAPGCPQALGATRDLARALAPNVTGHLHVSGCAKGCAHPAAAPATLVATPNGYDLVRNGSAADPPSFTNLPPHLIADHLKDPDAPPL